MQDVEKFHAVLQLVDIRVGRNTVRLSWKNVLTDETYEMTAAPFRKLVQKAEWVGPLLVDGLWRRLKTWGLIAPVFTEDT
jgi:hypothetical protein